MKRLLCCVLLLCLGLAGCGLSPVAEEPMEAPSLPVPVPPKPVVLPQDLGEVPVLIDPELEGIPAYSSQEPPDVPTVDPSDIVPISELPEEAFPHVRGPAGTVRARTYLEPYGHDPVYGDVDGDGQTELVYWCCGPTSGLFTVGICVYGLEQGWPVLKGSAIFNLRYTDALGLEEDAGQVIFRCTLRKWDDKAGGYTDGKTLRLSVTLADGLLLLNGGDLPEGLEVWGGGAFEGCGGAFEGCGGSFSALREQVGDEALLDLPRCLVWQRTVPLVLGDDSEGMDIVQTCAAVTDNGVTVTGYLTFEQGENGVVCTSQEGLTPIPPVADPEALAALTAEEREARLGPCHFWWSIGSGISHLYEFWFTEDGKLLSVYTSVPVASPEGSSPTVGLWDMTAGKPYPIFITTYGGADEPDDDSADLVTVHQETIPTEVENAERWEGFLTAAALGEENEVTLRLVYEEGTYDLALRYDGEVYILVDEGITGTYKYLLASEEDAPRPGAKYRRAVHYILSDDPELTWEQYMARMASSSVLFDQAAARGLFTVYE